MTAPLLPELRRDNISRLGADLQLITVTRLSYAPFEADAIGCISYRNGSRHVEPLTRLDVELLSDALVRQWPRETRPLEVANLLMTLGHVEEVAILPEAIRALAERGMQDILIDDGWEGGA